MITRSHIKDDAPSVAVYSDCEQYRYALTRVWDPLGTAVELCYAQPLHRHRGAKRPHG